MKTVCSINQCTSCTACIAICPKNCISLRKNFSNTNAIIDNSKCINCGLCYKVCQQNNSIDYYKVTDSVYEGFSLNELKRSEASSGGFATILAENFIKSGGYVAGSVYHDDSVHHILTNNILDLDKMKGSKYVKSELGDIFLDIKNIIKDKKVLFIGTPCQVYGLKMYLKFLKLDKNLVTIDIICHGTPQQELFLKFVKEEKLKEPITSLRFRYNHHYFISFYNHRPNRGFDLYTLGFLHGLFYTENCYNCKFAKMSRVSDITLGDSWGTKIADEKKGVSLCICNTPLGLSMFNEIKKDIFYQKIELDYCASNNEQLIHPSKKHRNTNKFFSLINHHSFNFTVMICLPITFFVRFIKNIVAKILVKFKVLKD